MRNSVNKAVLSLGSNLPTGAKAALTKMLQLLDRYLNIEAVSELYSTKPYGASHSDKLYHNAVALISTEMELEDLQKLVKQIEKKCGRRKHDFFIAADIDIVIWNSLVIRKEDFDRDYFRIGYTQFMENVED